MTDADDLDAILANIAREVEDAKTFMYEHGLTSTSTRKLPSVLLHTLERWRIRTKESSPHTDLH